ncbi:MAG: hypothetical protein R2755_05590 [Acidimicrobiales bacterium]
MSSRSIAKARSAAGGKARYSAPTMDGFHLAVLIIVVVGIGLVSFARSYRVGHKTVDAPAVVTTTSVVADATTTTVLTTDTTAAGGATTVVTTTTAAPATTTAAGG